MSTSIVWGASIENLLFDLNITNNTCTALYNLFTIPALILKNYLSNLRLPFSQLLSAMVIAVLIKLEESGCRKYAHLNSVSFTHTQSRDR